MVLENFSSKDTTLRLKAVLVTPVDNIHYICLLVKIIVFSGLTKLKTRLKVF